MIAFTILFYVLLLLQQLRPVLSLSDSDQALAIYNHYRADAVANHSSTSGPLRLDVNLNAGAQSWALHMANTNNFTRSGTIGQGEFIAVFYGGGSIAEAAKYLAYGKEFYHGEILPNGSFEQYDEYTQMVWPSTTALGLGSANASNGYLYVCGRYESEGNVFGESAWGPGGTAKQI